MKGKQKKKKDILNIFSCWWLYPILWILCIIALMIIGYLSGEFSKEIFHWKGFLLIAMLLPMGLVFFGFTPTSDTFGLKLGVILYYALYIVAFSVLPFVKEKWEKILIGFLLVWIFLAFFGCAIGISLMSGGGDW